MGQLPEGRALRPREWRWFQVRGNEGGPEEGGDNRPNARLSPSASRVARAASPVNMASSRIGAGAVERARTPRLPAQYRAGSPRFEVRTSKIRCECFLTVWPGR